MTDSFEYKLVNTVTNFRNFCIKNNLAYIVVLKESHSGVHSSYHGDNQRLKKLIEFVTEDIKLDMENDGD